MKFTLLAGASVAVAGLAIADSGDRTLRSSVVKERIVRTAPSPAAAVQGSSIGPDVIVGQVGLDPGDFFGSFANYPSANGYRAYAVNTTSCNVGDENLLWFDGTEEEPDNRHPVILQNMYRFKDGRFEQIGLSWLKHGFCALSESLCGPCNAPIDCDVLVPGCSDPYSAGTNGNIPGRLGPRHEVNPRTGDFPFPFETVAPLNDSTYRRLRVLADDVTAASNPGATWFVEVQYVAADDAAAGNDLNNASHREVTLDANGAITNFSGATVQELPAIMAWPLLDPAATVTAVDVPDAGRLYVGHAAHDLGDGTWAYEYAILNYNCDRPAWSVDVETDATVCVTETGFNDVEYITGEPSDNVDWAVSVGPASVTWSTLPVYMSASSNVLRWSTMYNYRFISNGPPVDVSMAIELADDALPTPGMSSVQVTVKGPGKICRADCSPPGGNGTVNIDDLLTVVNSFGTSDPQCDITPVNADCTIGNAVINIDEIVEILNQFGPC